LGKPIVIVGAGGMGREVFGIIAAIEEEFPDTWDFLGFVADDIPPNDLMARLGAKYLGGIEEFVNSVEKVAELSFIVAIGDGKTRKLIEPRLIQAGLRHVSLIHPSVILGIDVTVGSGAIICANSVLTTNIRLGNSVLINIASIICHDVSIGNHVTLSPGVNLNGSVKIADEVNVFSSSIVLPGVLIGARSIIGAGSVVTKDVPSDTTVIGIPAKKYVAD
jgi:sugar O-acyltransferase (sialic acid O-acetyltransferase NeuD family)